MKLTDALSGEHAVLRRLLDYADPQIETWTLAEMQTAAATVAAALLSHAEIEDELLFAALAPHFGETGPVAAMREEHEQIDQAFARLDAAGDLSEGRAAFRQVNALSRAHFAKEEAVLFHLAERVLAPPELEGLGKAWARCANTSTIHQHCKEPS